MTDEPLGIRDGEIAVELPDKFDASLYFIGRIRTPWTRREDCPKNARESDAVCTIVVDARWAEALIGIETCSHLVVLYWMSRSRRDLVLQVPRHYGVGRGTFALASTIPRSSTSSPISPRPMPSPTRSWVGTQRANECGVGRRRYHDACPRGARG